MFLYVTDVLNKPDDTASIEEKVALFQWKDDSRIEIPPIYVDKAGKMYLQKLDFLMQAHLGP